MGKNERGVGVALPSANKSVGMPNRVFLFTLDQLGMMLDLEEQYIATQYIYFEGRSIGSRKKNLMIARNIAPPDEKPDWRVAEREFIRWMRTKGFRHYERGAFSN